MSRKHLSSGAWLVEIYEAEKRIAQLLEVAADTLSLMSGDLPDVAEQQLASEHINLTDTALRDPIQRFEKNTETYFTLLDDIQQLLRKQFRTMVKESVGTRILPVTLSSYGEEKDLALVNDAVGLARDMTQQTLVNLRAGSSGSQADSVTAMQLDTNDGSPS
ncbi:hypothetical protein RI367_004206 [Sorochytrium milnesiophthora]